MGTIPHIVHLPFYRGKKGDRVHLKERNLRGFKPSSLYVDLEDYYRSIRRMMDFDLPLIPGHEIGMMKQEDLLE